MAFISRTEELTPVDFRQLRHQTKNALARILAQVSTGLSSPDACRRTAADVERRILLTATISDALFGLTREPGPFAERLRSLCDSATDLAGESDQFVTLSYEIDVEPEAAQVETLLRVAHEFIGNAVKHGMHMRLIGRIEVSVARAAAGLVLQVRDDGWGCGREPAYGEGMRVAGVLAEACGGRVSLSREGDWTVARLVLPAVADA